MKLYAASLEITLAAGGFIGFLMKIQSIWGGQVLLVLSLSLLILLYVSYLFLPLETMMPSKYSLSRKILRAVVYLIAACTTGALLLKLSLWPYADFYLEWSTLIYALLIVVILYRYRMANSLTWVYHYRNILRRSLFILSTAFLFYVTPLEKLVKLYYKQEPEYAKLLIQYLRHPENKAYQLELQEAKDKLKK